MLYLQRQSPSNQRGQRQIGWHLFNCLSYPLHFKKASANLKPHNRIT